MTAEEIKLRIRVYYLWKRQFYLATQEQYLNVGIADVLIWDKNFNLIEIEIKISKSDFNGEFNSIHQLLNSSDVLRTKKCKKHYKHEKYLQFGNGKYIPNRFYFCVPAEMKDYVYEKLKDTPYGLLVVNVSGSLNDSIKVIKSGRLLHTNKVDKIIIENSFKSLCCENLRLKMENKKLKEIRKQQA